MPVTFRAASQASADTNNRLTCPKPTGTVAGDLLVAIEIADPDGSLNNMANPTGGAAWTLLGSASGDLTGVGVTKTWWKVAGSSEPASYDFGQNPNADTGVVIAAYQAGTFDEATPLEQLTYSGSSSTSTTHTAPAVNGVVDGALLCAFMASESASATRTWSGYTTGLTEIGDTTNGGWIGIAVAHQLSLTSTASTGTKQATCSDNTRWRTQSLIVRPFRIINNTATANDTAAATDSVVYGWGRTRAAGPDPAAATDSVTYEFGKGAVAADSAAATDQASRVMQMQRGPIDVVRVGETVTFQFSRADIEDFQFVLSEGPQDTHTPWVPFGLGQTVVAATFNPGTAEDRRQDVLSPVADVRWMGVDVRTPPTWEFDLYTDIDYDPAHPEVAPQQAMEWAEVMEDVWNNEEVRSTPNAAVPLRYKLNGRMRRVYGRPGNFTLVPNFLRTGRVHMLCDFRLTEHTYYDDKEETVLIRTVPSTTSQGGVTFPITFPMTIGSQGDSPRVEQMVIAGRRPTWVDVTFFGPCIDPWIEIGGVRWGLRGAIEGGMERAVTMSGKPWSAGVRRADGLWLPGMLGPQARLSQLRLPRGTYSVKYGAYDPAGTSYATVAWRGAHGTM
jgi:hypothetical protein